MRLLTVEDHLNTLSLQLRRTVFNVRIIELRARQIRLYARAYEARRKTVKKWVPRRKRVQVLRIFNKTIETVGRWQKEIDEIKALPSMQ